jgi:hypothetical protein
MPENAARREAAVPSVQPLAPHTKCDGVHAVLGGGVVDESPIYELLTNSRLNPIDFLCSTNQFHEVSQRFTSHAKSSPSSCPSPTHPPTYPNI